VIDVSQSNGLVWDAIVSCQMIGAYTPHGEACDKALAWLGPHVGEAMMVACHNFDLDAAQEAGMRTAIVRHPHARSTASQARWSASSAPSGVSSALDRARRLSASGSGNGALSNSSSTLRAMAKV
jgi:beta-phosphoglucomutase-like phosphatase (HAD superfamily)